MHSRNRHRDRYDFKQLIKSCPELASYRFVNKHGDESIDFANPVAVKLLNQSLLKDFYKISWWDIPPNYLCPPIPGRADYLHNVADLLATSNNQIIPRGKTVQVLDVGVGANCVYPLIGQYEYGWKFIGSDIDNGAIESASRIVKENNLKDQIELRQQTTADHIFSGIIKSGEFIDLTLCNPPFHASAEEATAGSERKFKGLGLKKAVLNFGGKSHELWSPGGEKVFVSKMIEESAAFSEQCLWFTSLISKKENLPDLDRVLNKVKAIEVRILEMSQGQKVSRVLAWTFQNQEQHKAWANKRWI
jgi:23S rRNA (adenine1618-N6)-methyltransferase